MTYDIFISYKRRDTSSAIAALVYNYLSTKGYKVFFDRKEIRQGRFNEQLYNHIEAAKDIIILLEETSLRACFSEITDAYKTDWFCKEVMHALELEKDKHIIPILLGGYTMPEPDQLPEELKSLPLQNAISLDASEMDEVFQKYFINQGYLLSKPQNILPGTSLSIENREGISDFLFYTTYDCDIYECGEKMLSLSSENDEEHPYRYGVKRSGEHRFHCINNDTCEEIKITETIETGGQKYIELKWKNTQNLWELTGKNIESEENATTLFEWGNGLFWGTSTHLPDLKLAYKCLEKSANLGNKDAIDLFVNKYSALFDREMSSEDILPWLEKASELGSTKAKLSIARFYDGLDDAKSVAICTEAANEGDVNAMYHLGRIYLRGEQGVTVDSELSESWYNRAIEMGSTRAMCDLAYAYERGEVLPKNDEKAAQLYQLAVDSGSKTALTMLGNCYREGIGVEQNKEKAVELYKKAVESGNMDEVDPWSQYIMGLCFSSGTGVERDESKALDWFYKAARNGEGNIDSMFQIGFYNLNGIATEQNYKQAFEWFCKASEKNDPDSNLFLGYMYNDGLYVECNHETALKYFTKAADSGIAHAMTEIGFMYLNGNGVEVNEQDAAEWFRKGADLGDRVAQRMAAFSYTGNLIPNDIDLDKALSLFELSAAQGDANSLYQLGGIYSGEWNIFKNYTPIDLQKAFNYFESAAQLGYPKAQFEVGRLFEYQDIPNFKPNYEKALYWYQQAAENEYIPAYDAISHLYELGNGVEKSENKAIEWRCKAIESGVIFSPYFYLGYNNNIPEDIINSIKKASQKGYTEAKKILAELYLKGKAECEDPQIAIDIYKEVAAEGDLNAQYKLASLYLQKHILLHKYYVERDIPKAIELLESTIKSYEKQPFFDNGAVPYYITGAYYKLAMLYKKGEGVTKDENKALTLFNKAAENGTYVVLVEIVNILKKRYNNISDFYRSLSNKELLDYALSCFKEACEEMSRRYREGDGKEQNAEKALYWRKKGNGDYNKKTLKQKIRNIFKKESILTTSNFEEPQKWFWQK